MRLDSLGPYELTNRIKARDTPPSPFSLERRASNRILAEETFGADFFCREGTSRSDHPLLKICDARDWQSNLEVDWLAEDLRLLNGKPKFDVVLRDLRNEDSYASARHTLHVAALFERSHPGTVVRFVESQDRICPDFVVNLDSKEIPVEAKLLMESATAEKFGITAKLLAGAITECLKGNSGNLGVFVVLPDALDPPSKEEICSQVIRCIGSLGEIIGFEKCGVRVDVLPKWPGVKDQRLIHLVAPIHEKDYLRIAGPARKASKQLRSSETSSTSGILALGLSNHDASAVIEFLGRRMRANRFRGIAATIVNKRVRQLGSASQEAIDLLEVSYNDASSEPLNSPFALTPMHLGKLLSEAEPSQLDQPAYSYSESQAVVSDVTESPRLYLPDIRRVSNELLRKFAKPGEEKGDGVTDL